MEWDFPFYVKKTCCILVGLLFFSTQMGFFFLIVKVIFAEWLDGNIQCCITISLKKTVQPLHKIKCETFWDLRLHKISFSHSHFHLFVAKAFKKNNNNLLLLLPSWQQVSFAIRCRLFVAYSEFFVFLLWVIKKRRLWRTLCCNHTLNNKNFNCRPLR